MSNKLLAAFIITAAIHFAPATLRAQDEDYIVHTIKHGEVPAVLAKKYNVALQDLVSLNKWNGNVILHVGDKVKLPITAHLTPITDTVKPASPVAATPTPATQPEEALEGRAAPSRGLSAPMPTPEPAHDTVAFVWHKIERGEVPSVLAKKYNISLDDLRAINNWNPHVIWHVGDKVKLPATAHLTLPADTAKPAQPVVAKVAPVVQAPAVDTTAKKVTPTPTDSTSYTVQKKETLYAIGKKFNVKVDQIRAWNHLAGYNISEGQKLVIYTNKPLAQPAATAPPVQQPPVTTTPQPVVQQPPVTTPPVVAVQQAAAPRADSASVAAPAEGYFTSSFGKDVDGRRIQTAGGVAMTFKTASGWTDKKYYILINDVNPGSIVKVTNAAGQSVYAKVLWNMGDAKENEGLNFRISDAAAAVLGLKEPKFQLNITYYQ